MDKKSKFDLETVHRRLHNSSISPKYVEILDHFFLEYSEAVNASKSESAGQLAAALEFVDAIENQCESPYEFEPFHKQVLKPYNYYNLGCRFIRPLIDISDSHVLGTENIQKVEAYLAKGENVVFLSNHQVEADPHVIFSLLKEHPFASEIIFVAGERVVLDPLAVPFSLGCNLLCIFSKKYIDHPPEKKGEKQEHNRKTMQKMRELLDDGGRAIWVAPSGGRDRISSDGVLKPAPFDPQSVEMFNLIGKKSAKKTHIFPMSISAYDILPPPKDVQIALGEKRSVRRTATGLFVGDELDIDALADQELPKKKQRQEKAAAIYQIVKTNYDELNRHLGD